MYVYQQEKLAETNRAGTCRYKPGSFRKYCGYSPGIFTGKERRYFHSAQF